MAISLKMTKVVYGAVAVAMMLGIVFAYSAPKALTAPAYDYQLITQSAYPANLAPGASTNVWIEVKNTGAATWYNSGANPARLGTGSVYGNAKDYASEFAGADWLSTNRPVAISHPEIKPGWHTRFQFNIKAPATAGVYKAYFTPVVDGLTWMKDIGIFWQITVTSDGGSGDNGGGTVVPAGSLGVALAASSPAGTSIIGDTVSGDGAQALAPMTSLVFTAGSGTVKVTGVKLYRNGIAADTDLANVYLYKGGERISDSPIVATKYFSFTNSAGLFSVTAGSPVTIEVKADVVAGVSASKTISLGINANADITSDASAVTGAPVFGATMTTATVADLGKLTLAHSSSSAAQTAGLTDQELWKFSLTAADQKIDVLRIKLTAIGTIDATALTNLYLHDGVTQIGTKVAALSSDKTVVFDLSSAPYRIDAGAVKLVSLRGDIPGGSSRTFYFSVQNSEDLVAKDVSYGVYVKPNQSDTYTIIYATTTTSISAGSLQVTVATDSTSGSVAKDSLSQVLAKYNFKAIGEKIKITSLTVRLTGDADLATDGLDNGKILVDDTQIGTTKDLSSNGVTATSTAAFTFGSSFTIDAGQTKVVKIVADIKTSASATFTGDEEVKAGFAVGSNNYQRMVTGTTDSTGALDGNNLAITSASLSTTKNASLANKSVVKGAQDIVIGSWLITAGTAEGVNVTSVVIKDRAAADDANGAQGIGSAFDVLRLMSGGVQYGSTINSPSSTAGTTQTFSLSTPLSVNAGQSVQVDLVANVLTGASWTATNCIKVSSLTGVGKATSQTVTDSTGAIGQQLTTATSGSLSVSNESSPTNPNDALIVAGKDNLTVAAWKFTASNIEDLLVTRIVVQEVGSDDVPGNVRNLALYVDGVQVGDTVPSLTTGSPDAATFDKAAGLFTIPKNGNKTVVLKISTTGADNATFAANGQSVQFRIVLPTDTAITATSTISAKGATSNAYAGSVNAGNKTANTAGMKIVKTKPTFALASGSPSGTLIPGLVEVLRFTITADAANDVTFTSGTHNIRLTVVSSVTGDDADNEYSLYDNDNPGTALQTIDDVDTVNTGETINFSTFALTVPAGTTKTLFVKADLSEVPQYGSFQLSIQNAAADLSWSDGTTAADINDTLTGKGTPLYGGALVRP